MAKRASTPLPGALLKQAETLRARRALEEIDECRFVADSVHAGSSQEAVARALGVSQAKVSRLVKKVAEQPAITKPTVAELVNRAVAKQMSAKAVVEALLKMKVPYANPERKPDSDWAKIMLAYRSGLFTRGDARKLAADAAARLVASVDRSMELEAQHVPTDIKQRMLRDTTEKLMKSL